jgi:hypothetical protein
MRVSWFEIQCLSVATKKGEIMRRPFWSSWLLGFTTLCLVFRAGTAAAYVTDSNVYLPPNYYTFIPPAVGGSYADPIFGTTITRISNAAITLRADNGAILPWVEAEYSTKSPFNANNSKILLMEFSYFALYDGTTMQRIKPLCCPAPGGPNVSSSSEPLWSRTDPNTFYYHPYNGNQLIKYTLGTNGNPDTSTIIHSFSEYSAISAQGESEMSYDGDHLVLIGDGHQVFVYTISTNTKGTVFDASGHGTMDSVYISPNNNVLIAWSTSGTTRYQGEELYDINMNFLRQIANNDGHKHMTKDADGSEILVQTNSNDPTPIANCANGIVKINLATAAQTCLFALGNFDKWTDAVHITAPDQQGWVFVETYNVSSAASPWYPYTNELLQVALDGSYVRRYAHHRSDTTTYDGQPHISLSRDGSRFTFNSNMMGATTDVYMALLSSTPPPLSITTTSLPSGTQNTAYSATVTATGGAAPYTWSVASGSLPSGLTLGLSTSNSVTISGTPTGTGSSFTLQLADPGIPSTSQALSITINAALTPPSITTTSLPSGTQNTAYSATLTATGGTTPYIWSIVSGSLPAGLTLSSTGVISGTPSATGSASFTAQVTSANSLTATAGLSITINPASTSSFIEQDNPAVIYSGTWYPVVRTFFSGGSAVESMTAGDSASITFVGTGISWIGYKDAWSGIANVYLDGNKVSKGGIDTYSPTDVAQTVVYSITGLHSGSHKLTIQVAGQKNRSSGGTWIWVDAFNVKP